MLTKLEKVQIEEIARVAKYFGTEKRKYKKLEQQEVCDAAYAKAQEKPNFNDAPWVKANLGKDVSNED